MSDFVRAVSDARHELHSRDYDPQRAIVYCHPNTLREAKGDMDYMQPFNQGAEVFGMTIEATQNVPEDLVMVVHLDAMRLGPKAVAFSKVEESE